MAQLRDARTSELIAEGTPQEVVLLADRLGHDEILFDDVGLNFDPDAVRQAYQENLDGLVAAAKAEDDKETRERLEQAAADAADAADRAAELEPEALAALQEARARLDE